MRILIAALHNGYYRNLESVVAALAERGHEVYLGAERPDSALGGTEIVRRLAGAHDGVTWGPVPRRERAPLFLASKVRLSLDYLRYLDPAYAGTPALLARAEARTPLGTLRLAHTRPGRTRAGRRLLARALDALDRAQPPSPAIERFLDEQRPDVVLVTPLVGLVASSQLDLLRSAQDRRIPTGVCVWSWDHLSSKAIIRDAPDRLFVWNDVQRAEAETMHGLPPARVVVTGAQCFDQWFDRAPSRGREAFLRRVGLPDGRPVVLWVCSALLPGSPPEASFVLEWVSHLRAAAAPAVRDAAILIRPHPSRTREWEQVDWQRHPNVGLWGSNPVDAGSRADYFDSLHHSAAVVGLNTSAFLEAAIAGRPVMTILAPGYEASQEGTLHFRYLTDGGLLTVARSLDEHAAQLAGVLTGPGEGLLARQREFVRTFVRPGGLDVPATGVLASAVEGLGRVRPAGGARPASMAGRLGLRLLQRVERLPAGRRWLLDRRETEAKARRAAEAREASRVA